MKIRTLMTMGLMVAGFATMAQAQTYGYATPGRVAEQRFDERRDLRVREDCLRRIEADRRDVERERWELRNSRGYAAVHESRELRAAEARLAHDQRELHRY